MGQGNVDVVPKAGGLHGPTPAPGMGQSSWGASLSFPHPEFWAALPVSSGCWETPCLRARVHLACNLGQLACEFSELGDANPASLGTSCL